MPEPENTIALNGGRPTFSRNSMIAARAAFMVGYFFGSSPTSISIQIALTLRAFAAARTAFSLPGLCGSGLTVLCSDKQYQTSFIWDAVVIHAARLMRSPTVWNGLPDDTGHLPPRLPSGLFRST